MEINYACSDSNMQAIQDEYVEQSLSPCSSETADIFGAPEELPRIGDEYQAEIPPLISEHDYLQLIKTPKNPDLMANSHKHSLFGLAIPVTWSKTEVQSINRPADLENSEQSQITSNTERSESRVEPEITRSRKEKDIRILSSIQLGSDRMEAGSILPWESESKMDLVGTGLCPLPDSLGEPWTDTERDSFLLGLYMFGKNLVAVKKFIESKKMGDILFYYYGKFYRSDEYRRWSRTLKQRTKRSIHGQKIFTGWRQRELLSRFFSHVSQDCQTHLLEVSRMFSEGKISFLEYAFTLKDAVGFNRLIQAVGIGKGKDDLTGTALELIKSNQTISIRPEIPVGKACSFLSSADIIKCLTGNFRLSKARSNDLFWEAVWPRLLARGWHSEEPKNSNISGPKNSLVFLIPGVKKFSRGRLVKGNHYFDSVSDVLSKVASEPGLLELDGEAASSSHRKEEYERDPAVNHKDGLSSKPQHFYLQPRRSDNTQNLPKFTVVDTSMAYGEGKTKVRELRSLPVETACLSTLSSLSSSSDEDTSEDSQENVVETNVSNTEEDVTNMGACVDSLDCGNSLNISAQDKPDPAVSGEQSNKHQKVALAFDKNVQKTMKNKFRWNANVKSGCSRYLMPISKQHGNVARDPGISSCRTKNMSTYRKFNQDESHNISNSSSACERMVFQRRPCHDLLSASSLAKDNPTESNEAINEDFLYRDASLEKSQPPNLIDLNFPSVSPDTAVDESSRTATEHLNNFSCINSSSLLSRTDKQPQPSKLSDTNAHVEQQHAAVNRRQSTRNRPLTTKALEALETEFLIPTKKRKGEDIPEGNSKSRSSLRVRRRTGAKATPKDQAKNDPAESQTGQPLNGFHDTSNMIVEP